MFKIKVITKQYPTESLDKIKVALNTLIEGEAQLEKIGNDNYLYIEKKNHAALDKLYALIRQQKILDVARKSLRKSISGNGTYFFVNKQVAFVGKLNFCEEEGESPLGPIRVEIEFDDITKLIDWLTPYTKNGVEVNLVKTFP